MTLRPSHRRPTPPAITAWKARSLRGTLAENYFQGFKRAENRGTYTTPLSDAAGIEILRGPPSPIYGAGKVGGLVNFLPKTVGASDTLGGEASLTYGSYSKRNATLQFNAPVTLGEAGGGVHAYGEIDDSYSFYRGIHPSHQLLELSGRLAQETWSFSADYMYYHSNGDVQTPGWNRLTQALIDNGTYVTGRNTSLQASNGKYLTFNDLGGNPYTFDPNFQPLACAGCQRRRPYAEQRCRHHHPQSAARFTSPRAWISPTPSPTPPSWKRPTIWATARCSGCSCSAMCCRMTGLSPTVFPAPIAPRSARAGAL